MNSITQELASTSKPRKPRRQWFFLAAALLVAAIVLVGFAPTYYLKLHYGTPPLSILLHIHGLVFSAWVLLFFTQTSLVAARRGDLHRQLGFTAMMLAPLMLIIGFMTAVAAARLGHTPLGVPPLIFLVVPLFALLVFAILVSAGLYARKRSSETHKRLMLLATLSLLMPALGRLVPDQFQAYGLLFVFGVTDLILLACITWDTIKQRRLHPAMLWGGLLILLSEPARLALAQTAAWQAFASWLTQL